jgi:tripartite-type tricarboxylate transporter receptor subunit TctC
MKRRKILLAAPAAAFALVSKAGNAQSRYPARPVKVLVPFAPGQGSDVLARALSDKLSRLWEQPVIVENRSGANGTLAAQELARSSPDGHTLLLTSNSPIVINPNLYRKLPYSVENDFKSVALLATTELALVVTPSLPVRTVGELLAYARANPGKLSYGSPGAGSTSHLLMEAFKHEFELSMVHAPYKGSAPAMTDLMTGTIQLMMDGLPSSLPHVKSGRIRPLAVSGKTESQYMPGVPTLAASGVRTLPTAGGWYGLFVPTAVDAAVVQKLNADFASVMAQPDLLMRLKSLFLEGVPAMSPQQFSQFVRSDTAQWEAATRALGLYRTE